MNVCEYGTYLPITLDDVNSLLIQHVDRLQKQNRKHFLGS